MSRSDSLTGEAMPPRIDEDFVVEWSQKYVQDMDLSERYLLEELGPRVRRQGFYTLDQLLKVGRWKSKRTALPTPQKHCGAGQRGDEDCSGHQQRARLSFLWTSRCSGGYGLSFLDRLASRFLYGDRLACSRMPSPFRRARVCQAHLRTLSWSVSGTSAETSTPSRLGSTPTSAGPSCLEILARVL